MSRSASDDTEGPESLAAEILESLREFPEAGQVVLGGYFALKEHVDYRSTHDLDAWWRTGRTEATMERIRSVMAGVAGRNGLTLGEREWGETASFELSRNDVKVFSFQIALRSRELEPPRPSAWAPILVESLADTVGSKMNAVVNRGAPRDFLDVREVVTRGVATVEECWDWWSRKNPTVDVRLARAQALRHLEGIERRRPLASIEDPEEQRTASRAREWIRKTMLGVPESPGDG